MTVNAIIDNIIRTEGGYVDHPADRGGPTNWGITEKVARRAGYNGDMKALPKDVARRIYRTRYYEAPGFKNVNEVAPLLAEEMTDTGVNMGPQTATKMLQRLLNVLNREGQDYPDITVDGQLGPQSLEALHQYLNVRGKRDGEAVLVRLMNCLQGARYVEIAERTPSQEAFMFGWARQRVVV